MPDDRCAHLDAAIVAGVGIIVVADKAVRLARRPRLETHELARLLILCGILAGPPLGLILYALGVRV